MVVTILVGSKFYDFCLTLGNCVVLTFYHVMHYYGSPECKVFDKDYRELEINFLVRPSKVNMWFYRLHGDMKSEIGPDIVNLHEFRWGCHRSFSSF